MPQLYDLIAVDGGYLGVGTMAAADAGASPLPAVWFSSDRRTWAASPVQAFPSGSLWDGQVFTQVVSQAGTYAAVSQGPGLFAYDASARTWVRQDLGQGACPGYLATRGTVAVAVGGIGACGMGGDSLPAAWASTDGKAWQAATLADPIAFGAFYGVIAVDDGFIAWGWTLTEPFVEGDPNADRHGGAPWVSTDGVTWRRIDDREPFIGAVVSQVVSTGSVHVALGWVESAGDQRRAAWTSSDGQTWSDPIYDLPFTTWAEDETRGAGVSIGGGPSGLVAWTPLPRGALLWYSGDGVSWTMGPTLPVNVARIVQLGDALVALGTMEEADPGIPIPCTKDQVVAGHCRTVGVIWVMTP